MGKVQKKQEQELRAIKGKSKASEKAAKKAVTAKAKKQTTSTKSSSAQVIVAADDSRPEPPFRYELHVKNAQCIVEVTLHKVPPSVIDISKTNRRHLIVDCSKYTKKWYLDFELPHNMTIDPETADYTFESGILKCILTSDTGAVPESAKKEREDFINKVKDQKHLRFTTTKDGDLVVRNKMATLRMKEEKQKKKEQKKQEAATTEKPAAATKKAGAPVKAAPKASKKVAAPVDEATPAGTSKYLSDGEMAAMAVSIGTQKKSEIKDKVKELKAKENNFANRDAQRSNKKEARKEKQSGAFKRVVDEQRRKLAERIVHSQPKTKDTSGKKISFQ